MFLLLAFVLNFGCASAQTQTNRHARVSIRGKDFYINGVLTMHSMQLAGGTSAALAGEIRVAFNQKFFNVTNGQYSPGSQCANAIPLVMNLVAETNRALILNARVADVRQRGNALTTGDVGYRYLLRALAENGRSDVIYDMNNQSEKPGYGYQLKNGRDRLD